MHQQFTGQYLRLTMTPTTQSNNFGFAAISGRVDQVPIQHRYIGSGSKQAKWNRCLRNVTMFMCVMWYMFGQGD